MHSFNLHGTAYDSVIFDCDGVLLDSNRLKIDAFRDAALQAGFDDAPVRVFSEWQSQNFGTSRYRVFERLLSGEFGRVPENATLDSLLSVFGDRVRTGYLEVAEAPGLRNLLQVLSGVPLYVASGSDEAELRDVFRARGLARFFREIYGSPTSKSQIVRNILKSSLETQFIFVGDAHADADAARDNSVDFIYLKALSTVGDSMSTRAKADCFAEFEGLNDLARAISATSSLASHEGSS